MDRHDDECHALRKELRSIEQRVRALMRHPDLQADTAHDSGEVKANIMLVVRHVEDARMRIGKILQYADDGVSILDK